MSLASLHKRPRGTTALLVLILVASVAVIAWALWVARGSDRSSSGLSEHEIQARASQADTVPLGAGAEQPSSPAPAAAAAAERAVPDEHRTMIACRERATRKPLPGVRLYRRDTSVAGPSDTKGTLSVTASASGPLALWVEGWLPVAVRGETLPTEVFFDAAGASLEVRFLNFTPQHRLLRSVLQRNGADSIVTGPWMPVLEEWALDTWGAERVRPGTYDLYIWVVFPDGEPRPFSRQGFEVEGVTRTVLTIDMAAPRDPDDFESDD